MLAATPAPPPPPAGPDGKRPFHESLPRQVIALAVWVGFWMAAEFVARRQGLDSRRQLELFLGAGGVLGFAGVLVARSWLYRLLTSVRFAVAQGAFLVGSALLGLMLAPHGRLETWLGLGPGLAKGTLEALGAPEIFHSLWLWSLLALLAASTLAVAWKRRPYNLARFGFLLVHLAPSLVLAGGLWGRLAGVRVSARLRTGATVDTFTDVDGNRQLRLPGLRLRLERCEIRQAVPGYRIYARIQGSGARPPWYSPAYEAKAGSSVALAPGGYRMDLLQIIPDAVETGQVVENPLAPAAPALRVVLGLGLPEPLVGHLFARSGDRFRQDEPGGRFAVVFQESWDDGLLDTLRPAPAGAEKLVLASQGRTQEHSGRVGDAWDLPGYRLRVVQVYPDFAVRKGPRGEPEAYSRSALPREPWAQVDLLPGDGPARKLLLSAREPNLSDRLNAPNLPAGVTLHYQREGEEAQRRFVVFTQNDRTIRLLEDGRVVRTAPLDLRRPFIVEPGLSVTPVDILQHAEPVFIPNPGPGPGLLSARPVLRVKLTDPRDGSQEEQWLEPDPQDGPATAAPFFGGKVGLIYRQKVPEPGDFRSEIAVLDAQGRELARKTISLGDPLRFQGYQFFQSAGDPDDPNQSVIQVARRPGLGLTAAGFLCLLVGCAWMFYLKPVLKRRSGSAGRAKP